MKKAREAKEQGNAAFKLGDYPAAIGHYTQAILTEKQEPTFYLNRAAAYLKLGKHVDAENDCSKALSLQAQNAKGLYRRGQARIGLGKLNEAQIDLDAASRLEPGNEAIKQELQRVVTLLSKGKNKVVVEDIPYRRRIPIKIVEKPSVAQATKQNPKPVPKESPKPSPTAQKPVSDAMLQPVFSRILSPEPSKAPVTPPVSAPSAHPLPSASSFQEAKQAREQKNPNRVGGGIFRPSGTNTIFKRDKPAKPATGPIAAPKTLFELNRAWDSSTSVDERFSLITSIPTTAYRTLFGSSLEPGLLVSILETFQNRLQTSPNDADVVATSLNGLAQVPRLGTLLMFLSPDEKETVRTVLGSIGTVDEKWENVL